MPSDCISFQNSGYFSSLINDYLDQKPNVQPLYHRFPTLENFGPQIDEKKANFDDSKRAILVAVLPLQLVINLIYSADLCIFYIKSFLPSI